MNKISDLKVGDQVVIEEWKDILHFEDRYEVSNYGNIRSKERMKYNGKTYHKFKSKILNQRFDSLKNYLLVSFYKDTNKTFLVHRLVAINFIDNPENKKQVNHIDGIKSNNNALNLEWNTQYENMNHAFKTGLNSNPCGEKHNRAILTDEMYLKCVELRKQKITYAKIVEYIFDNYKVKVGRTTINAALTGQTWKQNMKENLRSYEKRKSKKNTHS